MKIIKLAPGKQAPIASDCIRVDDAPGGFRLTGSLLENYESRSIVDGELYASAEAAEDAGIAWAAECSVETLYVARNSSEPS